MSLTPAARATHKSLTNFDDVQESVCESHLGLRNGVSAQCDLLEWSIARIAAVAETAIRNGDVTGLLSPTVATVQLRRIVLVARPLCAVISIYP